MLFTNKSYEIKTVKTQLAPYFLFFICSSVNFTKNAILSRVVIYDKKWITCNNKN